MDGYDVPCPRCGYWKVILPPEQKCSRCGFHRQPCDCPRCNPLRSLGQALAAVGWYLIDGVPF